MTKRILAVLACSALLLGACSLKGGGAVEGDAMMDGGDTAKVKVDVE